MPPRKSIRRSPRKSTRKMRRSPVRKSVRRSPRKSIRKSPRRKLSCKESLKRKIAINMREYKKGRFANAKQAVAVSYSQVRKMRPACSRALKRRT